MNSVSQFLSECKFCWLVVLMNKFESCHVKTFLMPTKAQNSADSIVQIVFVFEILRLKTVYIALDLPAGCFVSDLVIMPCHGSFYHDGVSFWYTFGTNLI